MADRKVFLLDKEWKFNLGELDSGIRNTHSSSYMISKAGYAPGAAAPSYDDDSWRVLDLPHDYYAESDFAKENLHSHGYRTRSNSWYRKTFRLDEELKGRQILVNFEGISVFSEIFVNGSLIARSFSAYNEIPIDITDRVYFGDRPNVISVHIDGFATEGWWYEGAGIYRHVRLFAKSTAHIAHDGLWIKPVKGENGWSVECEVRCGNISYEPKTVRFSAALFAPDGSVAATGISGDFTIPADSKTEGRLTLTVGNPEIWDIDDPKLYTAKIRLFDEKGSQLDSDSTRIGFREFYFDADKGFFLNGRSLKIKGVCCHQDHAGVGVAVPDSIQYYRIKLLKEMGVNGYRCSHNLPAREILDACDEYGILVMDENRRFESRPEVLDAVEQMVRRDRNHPSVIMYSLFNEEPLQGTAEGRRIYMRMLSRAKSLDDTRYYTGAMNGGLSSEGAGMEMSVVGINYGLSGIEPFHEKFPELAIVGSENNSAVTTRGCYKTDMDAHLLSGYDEERVPWGQLIRETWKFVLDHEYMSGIFIWTGFDYRGEPTPFEWPSVSSQFGIMDTCGFPKDSYYFNKACFVDEPMMYILPHWNHGAGETVRVMTVTNCDEAELFLNGVSLGRRASNVCEQLEWQVKYEPGVLSAKGYRNGEEVSYYEVKTTGKAVRLGVIPARRQIANDGMDTVAVNICALDAEGNVVPTADNLVKFTLNGYGAVIGVGNGDPNSHEPDNAYERKLYCGWCQALVQTKSGGDGIVLTASSEGLVGGGVVFEVKKVAQPAYIYSALDRRVTGWRMSPANCAEAPDPLMIITDDDMNSLEPTDLGKYPEAFTEGWRLYRAFVTVPAIKAAAERKPVLRFDGVLGSEVGVWCGGRQAFSGSCDGGRLEIELDAEAGSTVELRVLVKAPEGKAGGLKGHVKLV